MKRALIWTAAIVATTTLGYYLFVPYQVTVFIWLIVGFVRWFGSLAHGNKRKGDSGDHL